MRATFVRLVLWTSIASVSWGGCTEGQPIGDEPLTEERCMAGAGIWDAHGRTCVDDRDRPRAFNYPRP